MSDGIASIKTSSYNLKNDYGTNKKKTKTVEDMFSNKRKMLRDRLLQSVKK